MTIFNRSTSTEPTAAAQSTTAVEAMPDDWPGGALNPDSPFFVPEDLRDFYRVDRDAEDARRSGAVMGSGLPQEDNDLALAACTPSQIKAAGLTYVAPKYPGVLPVRPGQSDQYYGLLKNLASRITPRDRDLYRHARRLANAARDKATAAERARIKAARAASLTCEVCEREHVSTSRRGFTLTGLESVQTGVQVVRVKACQDCSEVLRTALLGQYASTLRSDGVTISEAATRLVTSAPLAAETA